MVEANTSSQTPPPMPKIPRQIPKWADLQPLLGFRKFQFDGTERRLSRAVSIEDLRMQARRRTPRSAFDYTDGAADHEASLRRSRELFNGVEFRANVLRDIATIDMSTTILGGPSTLPFGFAPTGFTRMMHYQGETAVAHEANTAGIPFALSTMGTTSLEDVAKLTPDTQRWFQLYVWKGRVGTRELVERAAANGYSALLFTVDTAVAGQRQRDVRNGLTIPPQLTPKTFFDMSLHPAWWANLLTTAPLEFASLRQSGGTVAGMINRMFDPSLTFDDVTWLRSFWPGKLVVKGIQTVEDGKQAIAAGADAVLLSNHGGRQLDRARPPLRLLPDMREALGPAAEIMVDGGIMNGGDIVAAHALGASFTLVGRAYLYGLMAGGYRGVRRAIEILSSEVNRTMQLLGVDKVADLEPRHVVLP